MSLVEAVANVAVGFGVAVLTRIAVFPWFGLHTTLSGNLAMGGIFTLASIVRSYFLLAASIRGDPGAKPSNVIPPPGEGRRFLTSTC